MESNHFHGGSESDTPKPSEEPSDQKIPTDTDVKPSLGYNPLVAEFITYPKNLNIELITQKVDEANDLTSLYDVLEALTAEEFFVLKSTTDRNILKPVIDTVLAKILSIAKQTDESPRLVAQALSTRAFRGVHEIELSRPIYVKDFPSTYYGTRNFWDKTIKVEELISLNKTGTYHTSFKSNVTNFLKTESKDKSQNPPPNLDSIIQKYEQGDRKVDFDTLVYFEFLESSVETQMLIYLTGIDPKNTTEINIGIESLALIDYDALPTTKGLQYIETSMRMIRKFITVCANDLDISNAKAVEKALQGQPEAARQPLTIRDIINLANGFRRQIGQEELKMNAQELEQQIPIALDTLADVIINYGQNNLSEELKEDLAGYAKLAGDTFVIGKFLKDKHYKTKTIEEFLTEHPNMSAVRMAGKINKKDNRHIQEDELRDLRGQFGSAVYWNRRKRGYGIIS
jgi:hypothetical protein